MSKEDAISTKKITCDDLHKLLVEHLQGTVLEAITTSKDYVIGEDGFVAPHVIDNLCDVFRRTILIFETPNPRRRMAVGGEIAKIEGARKALQLFKTHL